MSVVHHLVVVVDTLNKAQMDVLEVLELVMDLFQMLALIEGPSLDTILACYVVFGTARAL